MKTKTKVKSGLAVYESGGIVHGGEATSYLKLERVIFFDGAYNL